MSALELKNVTKRFGGLRANIAAKLDLKGSNALLQFAIRFQAELA